MLPVSYWENCGHAAHQNAVWETRNLSAFKEENTCGWPIFWGWCVFLFLVCFFEFSKGFSRVLVCLLVFCPGNLRPISSQSPLKVKLIEALMGSFEIAEAQLRRSRAVKRRG